MLTLEDEDFKVWTQKLKLDIHSFCMGEIDSLPGGRDGKFLSVDSGILLTHTSLYGARVMVGAYSC